MLSAGAAPVFFVLELWGSEHDSLFSLGVQRGIALCHLALHACRRGVMSGRKKEDVKVVGCSPS